ncbi:unnamed protein product [Adineta steineri]|uniref:Uncharacterized protein n=1 Tax=Adineta steineri TaxID=433720 RepID=A0A814VRR8_9BILA|nr:unnamed protein product [Adineta steineri]CAF1190954.1 unnamed protein product [Adineta steineri]
MSAYYDGAGTDRSITFNYLQCVLIYTIVEYNNTLGREILATAFNFTSSAIAGNLYQAPPYGSRLMNLGSIIFSANNQTGEYHFSSSTTTLTSPLEAKIDVTVNFNNKNQEHLNYNDQNELVGFFLSDANNQHAIQSRYQKNYGSIFDGPVLQGSIIDLEYTQVTNCVGYCVNSNYIENLIGNIQGLDENDPAACFYVPYTHFFNEPALSNDSD